ncbi:MAG: 2-oxoacid:acceptor oxidoreductase family protein [Pseudomonadales bacterium]|jgi:indolepyruvate ferredoxin oxidoreductase beta subunit|nr:2-oxoacid:acceptor oxidoreductase family protein [Pseudomonadales bacterium]MDP6472525.1 2-oxoacid:acceptor oxidoreductase family protein [Pseudomonadales bacterium]MDP6829006.1 2-oxoacid:acceptor oxidoreductase family protein [Pseudomonadales bacterium]MDP6969901.1 2-oxoacid:acceptor oxidoreductase family protein [Pseudomonadales bacterium]
MATVATADNDATVERPTNVLIVGVGGQGVVMVSKVLARVCQLHEMEVKQSEVHGMAKRGGSVFSHVRFGHEVWSPTITKGEVDVLVALEWAEGLRWLPYLNPETGIFIADTCKIVPPFSCLDRRRGVTLSYPNETVSRVAGQVMKCLALDASDIATSLGNERVSNTILLGVLSEVLDFPESVWTSTLAEFVPPKTIETNQSGFLEGRAWVKRARDDLPPVDELPSDSPQPDSRPEQKVTLTIVEAWCKGCDICVKMCPERCLAMNTKAIAVLTDADACTGCRLCEWLCPDLAIKVQVNAPSAQPELISV